MRVVVPAGAAPGECSAGRAERRSVAGEWLLWFARGGGPPHFCEASCPFVVSGRRALPGGCDRMPPGKASSCLGSVNLAGLAAVENQHFNGRGRVTPKDQLVQVVTMALGRGPP